MTPGFAWLTVEIGAVQREQLKSILQIAMICHFCASRSMWNMLFNLVLDQVCSRTAPNYRGVNQMLVLPLVVGEPKLRVKKRVSHIMYWNVYSGFGGCLFLYGDPYF